MFQKENDNFWMLCKENFGSCVLMMLMSGVILIPLGMSIVFDFRHTEEFAKERLEGLGFEQVEVLKKYSIGTHISPFPVTMENWFDFRAVKGKQSVEGRLVCHRKFEDFEASRCELAPP